MRADPDSEREILASLDELFRRYGVGDVDGTMELMVPDDDITLIEPGLHQFFLGPAEVRRGIEDDWGATEGEIPIRVTSRHVSRDGHIAWVNGELEILINFKGRKVLLDSNRFTAIARNENGRWLWHTISILITDPEMPADQAWNDRTLLERLTAASA
jgi:ketosteroid isomerase-like protein